MTEVLVKQSNDCMNWYDNQVGNFFRYQEETDDSYIVTRPDGILDYIDKEDGEVYD